jgi:arylsulfatase A-like enzyme
MFRPEDMPLAIMEPPADPVSPQGRTMFDRRGVTNMTESQSRLMTSHYYAKIAFDDDVIGRVIKSLTDQGLMDNTWIIYTSDHGEMLGDHRMVQKAIFYEGALNIPLIIRPPGGTAPWMAGGLTDHYDIVDTMLDAANGAPLENSHGVSLVPKIEAGKEATNAQPGKDVIFSEVNLFSLARTEQYKMTIDSISREPLELYDMENDPNELRNLVHDPSLSHVRDEMQSEHFGKLLDNINKPQLEVAEAGGITTAIHQDYPEY